MMPWGPHKVLKFVCQSLVEIFVNFVAWVLNKIRIFVDKNLREKILNLFNPKAIEFGDRLIWKLLNLSY